jgi:hypothetical protein
VGDVDNYRPPPPFAPPSLRSAPLAGPAAEPPAPPALPAPRRRIAGALLAVAGAAAVALTLLIVDRTTSPSFRRLSLPRTVAEFHLQRSLSPAEVDALASGGSFAGFASADLRSAQVGVYGEGPGAEPKLVLVGLSARADPDVRARLASADGADMADDVVASLGAYPAVSVAPGPLGGAVECGFMAADGTSASVGVWADRSTVGILELLETRSVDSTADLTRRFRSASEH